MGESKQERTFSGEASYCHSFEIVPKPRGWQSGRIVLGGVELKREKPPAVRAASPSDDGYRSHSSASSFSSGQQSPHGPQQGAAETPDTIMLSALVNSFMVDHLLFSKLVSGALFAPLVKDTPCSVVESQAKVWGRLDKNHEELLFRLAGRRLALNAFQYSAFHNPGPALGAIGEEPGQDVANTRQLFDFLGDLRDFLFGLGANLGTMPIGVDL